MVNQAKTVVVAGGTGGVGAHVVNAFVNKANYTVKILAREDTLKGDSKKAEIEKLKAKGVTIFTTDYSNVAQLTEVLKGADIVVSTLGGPALGQQQINLIKASDAANVKLFVPSEFGIPQGQKEVPFGFFKPKYAAIKAIKESKLNYILMSTGFFIDTTFFDWFGYDVFNARADIVGDGNVKISLTHRADVGKYLVEAVENEKYWNQEVQVATETLTLNEIIKIYEEASGRKFAVTFTTPEVLHKLIKANPEPFAHVVEQFKLVVADGYAVIPKPQNAEFPSVKPITLKEFAAGLFAKK
ncbi:hypothetical protein BKA69DRAFT_1070296 [Paraphysoderma sedebokerense]|nr:hypothetical protein BKA69DRAFT_1070296 [Paraphysoderma sedebokerense]